MGVLLVQRNVTDDIKSLPQDVTSFDRCMSNNACKVPVIILFVVAAIIIFSTLWCFIRCCMCGYACCSCCCGGCCDRRASYTEKHNQVPAPNQQQPPPPAVTSQPQYITSQPQYNEPPKYAYFEGQNRSDDALPIMPSMEATKYKLEVKEEHELTPVTNRAPSPHMYGDQNTYGHSTPRQMSPAVGAYGEHGFPNAGLKSPAAPVQLVQGYPEQRNVYGNVEYPSRGPSPAPSAYGHQEPPRADQAHLQQPGAGADRWGANRNTVQNSYDNYSANPYQQDPRQQQYHHQPQTRAYEQPRFDPPQQMHGQNRQEAWSAL